MTKEKFVVDLYIRVSTDRQAKEGDSLEEQESELKKFCEFKKFRIHKIYIERGKSGGNTNRPEYQKLVKDVHENKINGIVVKRIDRLSRSLMDFEVFMNLLQEKDIEFISLKENFDTTSAMGKAMLRVALVFAQLEREQTSERLIDVLDYRASQGLYNGGRRPFGYTNINKELVPYLKEKMIVEVMFEKHLELESTTCTAKFLNESGLRNRNGNLWDKRQVQKILQSPIYTGKVKWKTNLYQGIHQPIITEKSFQEVQLIFKKRYRIRPDKYTYALLRRLVFCDDCGCPMTPSHSINHQKKRYDYYRCTSTLSAEKGRSKCRFKYVGFKQLESRVINLLLSLSKESYFIIIENKVLKHNQEIKQQILQMKEDIRLLEDKFTAIKDKKDKYLDSLIATNFTSRERQLINDRINEIEADEKQLKGKLMKLEFEATQKDDEIIDLTNLKKLFITFKANHETFSGNQLKDFVLSTIKRIDYDPEKLRIKFKTLPWLLSFDI